MQSWQHFNAIEVIRIELSSLIKALSIIGCPPIFHISISIILTPLIIKAVGHLMTNDNADCTIVECLVSLRIEERILENTCRETDFVGCGVIISIDRLRSHSPLVSINRLTRFICNFFIVRKLSACHYIVIETLLRVDCQTAIISPFIRITHFHIKAIKLCMCIGFGRIAHPCLCINTLTKTHLQILNEIHHHLLR